MQQVVKKVFPVRGMSCASCAISVETMLDAVDGVESASVNYASNQVMVTYDEKLVQPNKLKTVIQSIGYDLLVDNNTNSSMNEEATKIEFKKLKIQTLLAFIFTVPIVLLGMVFMHLPGANWIMLLLSIPVVFYFGRRFFISAFKLARYGKANMDTLVALSTLTAFLYSAFTTVYPSFWITRGLPVHVYFEAATVIIVFILLGKLLEERAKSNTSSALKKLIQLQPNTVSIIENGFEKEIPTVDVVVGNLISVKPGEKIPVDGKITEGTSFVDESMITGEYTAVEKMKGSDVFAGTINQKGHFIFVAEKIGSETILGKIIQLVQEAQGSKAKVQRIADKVAGIFVPVVMSTALISFLIWWIAGGNDTFSHAVLAFVTVLIIACPCALGLATPTAMMVGIGKGAQNNILIKNADSLETGYKVNAVVIDKTGTLTEGRPIVTNVLWDNSVDDKSYYSKILWALESKSEHPLAEAVLKHFNNEKTNINQSLSNFESITGRGIMAIWNNQKWMVGNKKMIEEMDLSISNFLLQQANSWQSSAQTVVYFANQEQVLAIIAISDTIRPSAYEAIKMLHNMGIEVFMLTGDNYETANAVAKTLGIQHFESEVLPQHKASFIQNLQQKGKVVAMIGDGINDSQALAIADLGIAMGSGTDIAIDVAKITLITKDLKALPNALKLSEKTVKIIKQNLFWAFVYNIIGIPVAAGVLYPINGYLLNPMIAGAAMAFSSVSVVVNSLRLKSVNL